MKKIKHYAGSLSCRTTQETETKIKTLCSLHNKEISAVINYLCRIFLEDTHGIRTNFLSGSHGIEEKK